MFITYTEDDPLKIWTHDSVLPLMNRAFVGDYGKLGTYVNYEQKMTFFIFWTIDWLSTFGVMQFIVVTDKQM